MSSTNYTRWWRDGTVAVTKNSNAVTGTSTYWATGNINPGDIFKINGVDYEVQKVTDDTHITLATPYTGETGSGLEYAIVRNFTSTTNAKVAAQTSELMYDFAHFIDKEHATITGKSAYELAKDNGFVGTESQWLESLSAYGVAKNGGYTGTMAEWLESLKAAGEWSNADTRLTTIESSLTGISHKLQHFPDDENVIAMHNLYPRYKNLGTSITAAQYAAIQDKSFDDLYIGDYWQLVIDGVTYRAVIAQCGGNEWNSNKYLHIVISPNDGQNYTVAMNDTNTTEGGYLASKMHTEILPEFTTKLETKLGAEHIFEISRSLPNSNTYADDGTVTREYATSKLELLSVDQVKHSDPHLGGKDPLALFFHPTFFLPIYFQVWLQEVDRHLKNTFLVFGRQNGIIRAFANEQKGFSAHFILVP